jgi:hypothetical protein
LRCVSIARLFRIGGGGIRLGQRRAFILGCLIFARLIFARLIFAV